MLESSSSPAPGDGFQCQRPGRFDNPDDPSCRTYLTCIPHNIPDQGAFLLRQDECGVNALFSGRFQRCISGSDCATLEDFYAIEYECYECGKFVLPGSTDCRQFVNCLKTKDPGVFVPIRQSCPTGKIFSEEAHACVLEEEFECNSAKPTPKMPPDASLSPSAQIADPSYSGGHLSDFVCLSPGRFPDESIPHCRGYRWCTSERTADHGVRLVSRNFLCESGQLFSEFEKRCVPTGSYQCPDDEVSVDRFRCMVVGRFPDRNAIACGSYYHCQQTATGTLKATLAQCPMGTVFSWLTTRCVPSAEYVCPVGAIGADLGIAGETVAVVLPAIKQSDQKGDAQSVNSRGRSHRNRCSSSGRFANDADALCRTYFICTRDARGAWARVLVRCPAGTIFSRTASRCVGSETASQSLCPVSEPSTIPPAIDRNVGDSDERYNGSDEELECTEPDRLLPNPTDRTCRTYFGCRWDDVTERSNQTTRRLRLHLLQCPQGLVFSTSAARCMNASFRTDLKHTDTDDIPDDGSGAYFTFCGVSEDGSGEIIDPSPDAWLSTSTIPSGIQQEPKSTEQPTTINSSTSKISLTNALNLIQRIAPQDSASDDGGGSFSYSGPMPEYPCTATGRFADINSVDCRSYFLCKLQQPSGSFVSVYLTCPDGMVFSRNVNKCIVSNRHVC
uniref:Chitin-binding type-2 domain-containing protein n=1 Tax=Anopheles culicifacies TaxID=139723 RepID=A0A182M770_9DIPT